MIIDRIEEQRKYYKLLPEIELAFSFVAEASDLDPGTYDLDNGMFATITEGETQKIERIRLESHKRYIDFQYCISGGERMCWSHIQELNLVDQDVDNDNYYYEGNAVSISIRPGMFYIMFPSDGHKTKCHRQYPKSFKKVVIKIPVKSRKEKK